MAGLPNKPKSEVPMEYNSLIINEKQYFYIFCGRNFDVLGLQQTFGRGRHFTPNVPLADQVKGIFRQQASIMRNNLLLRRFYHYESVASDEFTQGFRTLRESGGKGMVEHYAQVLGMTPAELLPLATILSNAITYASMEMDTPPSEGLDFNTDEGWEAFLEEIDEIIDLWLTKHSSK